eukprot:CAMPEP_0179406804 /NCGR_PEP_ID=MMETSP0799-20121207/1119_1 /TAXON_ID=46947 /ORGANISM="Geminigera cryophila, Strain CCMP2564" /LENGTH=127 /DNA_ID=CAMNT_0021177951 /DNA_START=278 /DNA_END=661 /DNA_ORIENTATION=+
MNEPVKSSLTGMFLPLPTDTPTVIGGERDSPVIVTTSILRTAVVNEVIIPFLRVDCGSTAWEARERALSTGVVPSAQTPGSSCSVAITEPARSCSTWILVTSVAPMAAATSAFNWCRKASSSCVASR